VTARSPDAPAATRPLILASESATRLAMLRAAGLDPRAHAARLDEPAIRAALAAEAASPRDIADHLAETKALKVARRLDDTPSPAGPLILGADQVLVLDGAILGKPESPDAARAQLNALSGRSHELLSAAVLVENGAPIWRHVGRARLTMRPLSDEFIDRYLAAEGPAVTATAGGYRIEGRGAQLFDRIEGDWFSILGLPLLPLLAQLRQAGALAA
jgi:septum formation protein